MKNNQSKRNIAKYLRLCAKTIDEYGWQQGTFGNTDVGFCAIGAMRHVSWTTGRGAPPVYALKSALNLVHLIRSNNDYQDINHNIADWNDTKGRTKKEVVSAFRKAARLLEHGGMLYV